VFLAPYKNAAGVSTKIIEVLSRGIPVVTNSCGRHGLNLEATNPTGSITSSVLVATDSNAEFILKGIITLLEDKTAWDRMSLAGLSHAKSYLNEEVLKY
jgi:hypothetical protein